MAFLKKRKKNGDSYIHKLQKKIRENTLDLKENRF